MLVGQEMIEDTINVVDLIKKIMKEAQDCQKSCVDLHRSNIEFEVEEHIFIKSLPIKGVMRFDKSGKLSSRYMGPFKILKRVVGYLNLY